MANEVQISNMALSHLGASTRVSAIDPPDGSVEADLCALLYDQARMEMLEPGAWSFSLARVTLTEVTNPSTAWLFAYALPSDCVHPLRVLQTGSTDDTAGVPFTTEGDLLYSNEETAVLLYSKDITDTTKFTPSFAVALSYLLASYLAGPVLKGKEGAAAAESLRKMGMLLASQSATILANASSTSGEFTSSSEQARA